MNEIATTPQDRIAEVMSGTRNSPVTIDILEEICWQHFGTITDVQNYVTNLGIKAGLQTSVQDLGPVIRVQWGGSK